MIKLKLTKQPITKKFGNRWLPIIGINHHNGVDFSFAQNMPVSSMGAGVVTESGYHRTYGWYVKIDHGEGFSTKYHSLSAKGRPVGMQTAMGETIGYAGMSAAASTGPHSHQELHINGKIVDPLKYLKQGVEVSLGKPEPDNTGRPTQRAIVLAAIARDLRDPLNKNRQLPNDALYTAPVQRAVQAYKKSLGLPNTAEVDPATWAKLKVVEDSKTGVQTLRGTQALLNMPVTGKNKYADALDIRTRKEWGWDFSRAKPSELLAVQKKINAGKI